MTEPTDTKAIRERAKLLAAQRRIDRKNRKRHCALCGVEESERTPFYAHPDGIGPTCKDPATCPHAQGGATKP